MHPPISVHSYELVNPAPYYTRTKRPRRCIDYITTLILFVVWGLLFLASVILLTSAKLATLTDSEDGIIVTPDEVAATLMFNAIPILLCSICNEALCDRSWRRIAYFALGRKLERLTDAQLASNLRASNFNIYDFIRRIRRASFREWKSAASYALLRWGTTISIASVQLSVSWKPAEGGYYAHKRYVWVLGPVFLHACSIFGAMILWGWPCVYFSDRFNDTGLMKKYQHIMSRIQGSLATYEDIASSLETGYMVTPDQWGFLTSKGRSVSAKVQTGRQILPKLKGVSFGLICMFIPPALAWVFVRSHHVLTLSEYRFAFNLVFLAQNVFYVMALDFAIWNVSLDGLCKTPKAKPNRNLRYLGYSSGVVLVAKIFKQRRPLRSFFFLLSFWLQASAIRIWLVLYTFCVTVLSYSSLSDMSGILDPSFWTTWLIMTLVMSLPPFIIWILKKVEAPVCAVDGWRWAQIAVDALYCDGFYGVREGRAGWGHDVSSFTDYDGQTLI